MNTMKPAGLSGDPYTIYMNAERMLQMNPEGPMTETYRMQRDMALMQMRSPNYRGRRPQWLDREIASYPEMPGVVDRNQGTMFSKNPYGFTRDPDSVGSQAIVEWYNPTTGETWTAPSGSWRPPNDQWMTRNFSRMSPEAQKPAPIKSQPAPSPTMPVQPSFDPDIVTAFGEGSRAENESAIRSKYGRLPPQPYDTYKGAVYGR